MNNYITAPGKPSSPGAPSDNRPQATGYPDQTFWLQVYPPLEHAYRSPLAHAHALCPWGLAAELAEASTSAQRKQNILEALKKGLKTIRQYGVAARRIVFTEDETTGQISVWVD